MKISTFLNGVVLVSAGSTAAATTRGNGKVSQIVPSRDRRNFGTISNTTLSPSLSTSAAPNITTSVSSTKTHSLQESSSCSGEMTYMDDPPEFTYSTTTVTVTITAEMGAQEPRLPSYTTALPPCLTKYTPCPHCPVPPGGNAEKPTMILVTKKTEVYAPPPTPAPPTFGTTTEQPIPLLGPAPEPTSDTSGHGIASLIASIVDGISASDAERVTEPTTVPEGQSPPSDTKPDSSLDSSPEHIPEPTLGPTSEPGSEPTSEPSPNNPDENDQNDRPNKPNAPGGVATATIDDIPITVVNSSTIIFGSQTIPLTVPATGEPDNNDDDHDNDTDNDNDSDSDNNHGNPDDGGDETQGLTTVITTEGHTYTINPSEVIAPTTTFEFEFTSQGERTETPTSGNKDTQTTGSTSSSSGTKSSITLTGTVATPTSATETEDGGAAPTSGDDDQSLGIRGTSAIVSVYGGSLAVLLAMVMAL